MFSCESYKAIKNIYFTEYLRATVCVFSEILAKKGLPIILQYFRNSSCKLRL